MSSFVFVSGIGLLFVLVDLASVEKRVKWFKLVSPGPTDWSFSM